MITIDIQKVKEQSFTVSLGGQSCLVTLSQKDNGLYLSLSVDDKTLINNVICLNDVKLVRYKYLGFIGDLFFDDTQGDDNPDYTGLGDRFLLYYDGDA